MRTLAILIAALTFSFASKAQPTTDDWPQIEADLVALLSGNSEQKRTALAEIRNLRTEQASRLAVPALSDKDELVRATAASSIVFLPGSEAVAALMPLLNDKRPFVRREAAYALGRTGSTAATASLRQVMNGDRDLEVRAAAAVGIGNIGDPSALNDLLTILNKRPREQEEFLRRSAARAIGQIFELRFTGSTKTPTPQNFLPPRFKETGTIQPVVPPVDAQRADRIVATLSAIIRSRNESDDTRREAAFALGAMRRPENAAVLRPLTGSPDPYLAEIAREGLLKIGEKE